MERKTSRGKYLLAFILTLIVFSGGVFLGILLESARLNDAVQNSMQEKVNLQSLQLQQKYIDSGVADCESLNRVLDTNIKDLTTKGQLIMDYEKQSVLNKEEFHIQLRDYFLMETQFLLISEEIDKKCEQDSIKVIYFYDENEFDTQGYILDYLKKLFGSKILVFSFDSSFTEEPMISILLTAYKIKEFPSVVVGNEVFQGHTSAKALMQEMCTHFKGMDSNIPEECTQLASTA